MAIRTDAYYRGLADRHVLDAGVTEPPVSMERLAAGLGIPVRAVPLPAFFTAALIDKDGLPVILLNTAVGDKARRDALAHIIGHMLVILDDPEAVYPRDQTPDHRLADVVARGLLMPDHMVKDQSMKWFNDYRYLARLFGVTEDEMADRMIQMGLMKQRGIRWEY